MFKSTLCSQCTKLPVFRGFGRDEDGSELSPRRGNSWTRLSSRPGRVWCAVMLTGATDKGIDGMNGRLRGLVCGLLIAVAGTTTGCGLGEDPSSCRGAGQRPEGLVDQDLVGTYRGTGGTALTLKGDGSFTATGLPTDPDTGTEIAVGSNAGNWKLSPADGNDWPVALDFAKISYGTGFFVSGDRQDPHLYDFIGDPDMCDVRSLTQTN